MGARLLPEHPLANSWAVMIEAAGPLLRKGHDAWALYPIGQSRPAASAVPSIPGFTVYAVPAGPDWLYVGQTRQPLRQRLEQHLRDPYKFSTWPDVVALALDEKVTGYDVDRLERLGHEILRPRSGRRWARA
ncbi:hypothetical protein AB0H36_43280 [Kribbella sp. NPDC050820]|uniref:hypothetical protein n=1 Tax=Kribbella sp. NPDC050820 TaxID=3155408 RepID=UPI0033C6506E